MSEQIIVTIDPDGSSTVEAKGFKGATCKDATKQIEEALGKVTQDKKTPEFFGRTAARTQTRQGQ